MGVSVAVQCARTYLLALEIAHPGEPVSAHYLRRALGTYPMVRSVPMRNQLDGPTKLKLRTEADADPFLFGNLDGAPARVSDHCVLFAHVFRQRCVPRWSTLGSRDHQCRREEGASSS